jgi:UDP-N-acetylmuramate--alanine ligase
VILDEKSFHFVGIGGIGMSALADMLARFGHSVSGSDAKSSATLESLRAIGVDCYVGHDAKNVMPAQVVVVSSAVSADNPEIVRAKELGLTVLHRSELLAKFMNKKECRIAVGGTHGKTTTTAMIAWALEKCGLEVSYAFGGKRTDNGQASQWNNAGKVFVAEVDESDGSLQNYSPTIALVTNIDQDHLDHFGSFQKIRSLFDAFLSRVPEDGFAIVNWDNSGCRDLVEQNSNRLGFGTNLGANVRLLDYKADRSQIIYQAVVERDLVSGTLPMTGSHNLFNALACFATCSALGVSAQKVAAALATFPGVQRRLTLVHKDSREIFVFDDYAHNPGKLAASLNSIREAFGSYRVVAVFQPHRYSRLATMFNDTCAAFSAANQVFVTPVYAAGEQIDKTYTPDHIALGIRSLSKVEAIPVLNFDECTENVVQSVKENTVIVTLGAGDVNAVATRIAGRLHGESKGNPR